MFNGTEHYNKSIEGTLEKRAASEQRKALIADMALSQNDIDMMVSDIDAFLGTVQNAPAKERYEAICRALTLYALQDTQVYDIGWEDIGSPDKHHGVAFAKMGILNMIRGDAARTFKYLVSIADSVFFTSGREGIRVSFAVENIWE